MTLEDRLWGTHVDRQPSGCWEWNKTTVKGGYGRIKVQGKMWLAHRISYVLFYGEIPDGLQVLHYCDNPPCVRPGHLWAGTQADNMADMEIKGRAVRAESLKTHCPQGHPYTGENLIQDRRGWRGCRTCKNDRQRDQRHRIKNVSVS